MTTIHSTDKAISKKDLYLLKFQKYKEDKERQKTCHREQTLKQTLPVKTVHNGKTAEAKSVFPTTVTKSAQKENKKPDIKQSITKQSVVSKTQTATNLSQTHSIKKRPSSISNPPAKTSSALNVQKVSGSHEQPLKTDVSNSRKSISNVNVNKSHKSISQPLLSKPQYRKSTGRIVESRLFLNNKQGVLNTQKKPVQQKRRHSDVQKKTKPTSILKRKSCFASIGCEDELIGKTPDHGRSVRFISPDVQDESANRFRKTPARPFEKPVIHREPTPKHSAKKPRLSENNEQHAMRNKLDDWLKSKGKTPSKFRHLMCFHDHGQKEKVPETDSCIKRSLTVDELTEQKATIDREESIVVNLADQFRDSALEELDSMLEECTTLYEAGCPRDDILSWLNSIEQNIKLSKTYAKFYICKAQVLKSSENLEKVLQVYETAVINGAQPPSELASSLTGIVKEICQEREKKARRKSTSDVQEENIFESSAVVYTVRQVTPFSKNRRKSASDLKQTSPCAVVTPVRRSTRRSISGLPSSLQDKTPTYKSLEDMSEKEKKKALYFPNEAFNS